MIIVVMGVCSCGKTRIGRLLAKNMGVRFYDADDFHSRENVEKMKLQIPLSDANRLPWLMKMAEQMPKWESNGGAVLACSALKESYRLILKSGGDVRFVYLKGPKELILERMKNRKRHFMPATLLDSQLATIEEPVDAVVADIAKSPEEIVKYILGKLSSGDTSHNRI
ncbi:MAG: gluconokinase [Planctomycetota bacterium]|jgi:carbohydrate kinase (thermoresistant glucokinase family)